MVGSPATGRKKEVWISTEHGTDTAPGESPNYCRDSCRRPSGASFKRCESTQAAGGPGRGFRSRSEAARRGAGGGRGGAVSSHFVSELAAAETESKTCLPRPPCGPRGARVGWALTAAEGAPLLRHGKLLLFCILRGRVVPARRPGPPDGRGAGPARVRSCLGRRAREPGAGGASPGREAHPPAGAAPTSLHLLLRRGGARGTLTAGGEGEARGRGTPCRARTRSLLLRGTAVSSRSRFAGWLGLTVASHFMGEPERREVPRNGGRCVLLRRAGEKESSQGFKLGRHPDVLSALVGNSLWP